MPHDKITDEMLTAYALGEIDDDAERREIQAHLETNPDAAARVEQTRQLGEELTDAFAHEPAAALTPEQREAVTEQAESQGGAPAGPYRWRRLVPLTAAACALLAVGVTIVSLLLPSLGAARRTARQLQNSPQLTMNDQPPAADKFDDALPEPSASKEWAGSTTRNDNSTALEEKTDRERQRGLTDARAQGPQAAPAPEFEVRERLEPQNQQAQQFQQPTVNGGQIQSQNRKNSASAPQQVRQQARQGQRPPTEMLKYPADWPELTSRRLGPNRLGEPTGKPNQYRYDADGDGDFEGTLWINPNTNLPGRYNPNFNTEGYARLQDNPFRTVADRPLSTFSVDVDTASYANVRRFLLRERRLPPKDAVRIEEMVNYFDYSYAPPSGDLRNRDAADGDAPFAAHTEVADCPWASGHRLVRIGLKGWEPPAEDRLPANLVFLLDVSGSMRSPNKLPLLKQAFSKLTDQLREGDRVSIVVYAGASGLVLDGAPGSDKSTILGALSRLQSGGSTNGAAGIELAYQKAQQHFIDDGINRVILATDGDFNVGVTNDGALTRLIEDKAKTGVYLSVLGFGTGNVKDSRMEQLSNKGDGNYAYIDSIREAQKVLVRQAAGTLRTIAKDVKLQVEFNPAKVQRYRLIGYANRLLKKEDFNDDTKDAGDIGAGHTVTALYEVVPTDEASAAALEQEIQRLTRSESLPDSELQRLGRLKAQRDALGKNADQLREMIESEKEVQRQMTRDRWVQREARITELKRLVEQRGINRPAVDPLKYQKPAAAPTDAAESSDELLTLKLRYKAPDAKKVQGTSKLLSFPVTDDDTPFDDASPDFRFAASVAGFGMLLRQSEARGGVTYDDVLTWAQGARGEDPHGDRAQFIEMVQQAQTLAGQSADQ